MNNYKVICQESPSEQRPNNVVSERERKHYNEGNFHHTGSAGKRYVTARHAANVMTGKAEQDKYPNRPFDITRKRKHDKQRKAGIGQALEDAQEYNFKEQFLVFPKIRHRGLIFCELVDDLLVCLAVVFDNLHLIADPEQSAHKGTGEERSAGNQKHKERGQKVDDQSDDAQDFDQHHQKVIETAGIWQFWDSKDEKQCGNQHI